MCSCLADRGKEGAEVCKWAVWRGVHEARPISKIQAVLYTFACPASPIYGGALPSEGKIGSFAVILGAV